MALKGYANKMTASLPIKSGINKFKKSIFNPPVKNEKVNFPINAMTAQNIIVNAKKLMKSNDESTGKSGGTSPKLAKQKMKICSAKMTHIIMSQKWGPRR